MTIIVMQRDIRRPTTFRQIDLLTVPLRSPLPEVGDLYRHTDDVRYTVLEREFSYHGTRHDDEGERWNLSCTWVMLTLDGPLDSVW